MKNITVIDNKEFLNDYIDFRVKWLPTKGRHNIPTTKCFVHVWQKCNNMKEFWTYLNKLHCVHNPDSEYSLDFYHGGFRHRATLLIKKGVKLKHYPSNGWNPEKEKEVNELNELAALSLE
mgnify:FL=1